MEILQEISMEEYLCKNFSSDKNGQFRETENTEYARRRTKQKHNKET
jgi:hypothetical protein